MQELGKPLIFLGIVFILLGLGITFFKPLANFPIGRLPGDLTFQKDGFKFAFPLATCLLLSLLLTAVMWLIRVLTK